MSIDPDAYARLLCDWCLDVAPGQQILVVSSTLATEPVAALHRALVQRGAWPLLRLTPPGLEAGFIREAPDELLDAVAPLDLAEAAAADASLAILAPANLHDLAGLDAERRARRLRARKALREAGDSNARRWAISIWPTQALAQEARMSFDDYLAFVRRALFLDRPDPVGAWRELSSRQSRIVERLTGAQRVRIEADGTDLSLDVTARTWINSDGRRNMPSGEVFTAPQETSATGTIRFTVPSASSGSLVAGVTLRFRDGEVVSATADQGEETLRGRLATDDGARFLGELGIGCNPGIDRATGSTLLDEKIAGTVHLALGDSYPETGGVNRSALHWDLVCDLRRGGRVTVDGEPFISEGSIVGLGEHVE